MINAILADKLKVVTVKGRLDAILIKLAADSFEDILNVLPKDVGQALGASTALTMTEVGALLGIGTGVVSVLIEAGELPARDITRALVEAVPARIVFVSELADRLGIKSLRYVKAHMASLGVDPWFEGKARAGLLYSRVEAMAAIRDRHLIEEMME